MSTAFAWHEVLYVVGVSFLWGVTNVFISKGSKAQEDHSASKDCSSGRLQSPVRTVLRAVANWRFVVPFALNQLGSVLYMVLVVNLPFSLVVCTVNSLTFAVTALTGHVVGETPLTKRSLLGMALVFTGIALIALDGSKA